MSTNPKIDLSNTEKFKRDGARYVCRNCKAKYFTREDVEKCFDGHAAATSEQPADPSASQQTTKN